MTDVLICHLPEDSAQAERLADAARRAGYSAQLCDAPSDALTERIGATPATIILWSDAAAAAEWIRAEANVARGLKKLVQVSADGRPPPLPFDSAQSVSILTWQGEEDHPAWRGIAAALQGLCGPPASPPAAEKTAPPAAPAPAPPPPQAAEAVKAPARGPNALLIVGIVLLLLAALAAAWYMLRNPISGPEPAPPSLELNGIAPAPGATEPVTAPESPPASEERFDREAVFSDPAGHALLRSAPSVAGLALARLESGTVVATYLQDGLWWRVRTASGQTGYVLAASLRLSETDAAAAASPAPSAEPEQASAPSAARPRAERRPRGPRIRKENSEVMQAFCANAGRGTRECRRFRQLDR